MSNDFFQIISVFTEKKEKVFYTYSAVALNVFFADFVS